MSVIQFSPVIESIVDEEDTTGNYFYFFSTKPQRNENVAMIKIGVTHKQSIKSRLSSYTTDEDPITPVNIYYVKTKYIMAYESTIKTIYNKCRPIITCYRGKEFFAGCYFILKQIFFYISTLDYPVLISTVSTTDINHLLKVILELDFTIKHTHLPLSYLEESNLNIEEWICDNIRKSWVCYMCEKVLKNKQGYSLHIGKCKTNKQISLTCPHCNCTCSTIYKIQAHIKMCKIRIKIEEEKAIQKTSEQYQQQIQELENKNISLEEDLKLSQYENKVLKEQLETNKVLKELHQLQKENKKLKEQYEHHLKSVESMIETRLMEQNQTIANDIKLNNKLKKDNTKYKKMIKMLLDHTEEN